MYVEKPLTLRIEEGPPIVKAARVNNRICQVGMQQRSGKHYLEAKQLYLDTGKLGKITLARTWWHGNTYHLRKAPPALATQPSNLDWAHFLGPLKWRDWDPQQYYNWRAYLERLPNDPWGTPYHYLNPGANGEVDVFSLGADGKPDGDGVNADIGSWQL